MDINKHRVFVFCRHYLIPDFQENVAPLVGEFDFKFLTDGRRSGIADTRKRFYSRLETARTPAGFSEDDEMDVVARCRYLSNLPRLQALKMLRAMGSVLEEELDLYRPQLVLAQMVDEYVTHLLSEIARRRGIVYVGYIYSYFPGKSQIVLFSEGRPLEIREPLDVEVNTVWEEVSPHAFRQNYRQNDTYTRLQHLKAMLRYRVKKVAFHLLAWRDKDPLNLHYGCLPYTFERRYWRDFPLENDFHQDWLQLIKIFKFKNTNKPILYFPLAYFPESSTNYWIENKKLLDYQNSTLSILSILSEKFIVIVKEHMHMLGGRDAEYYREIKRINDVISVPPAVNSNDVLSVADAALLGGGSIGIEAFLRCKPLLTFCSTSCWFSASGATYLDLSDIPSWEATINKTISTYEAPSGLRQFEFLKQCLRSTMRIRKPGKLWPICNAEDLRSLLEAAIPRKL